MPALGELEGPLALFHGHRPALPTASSIHSSRGHQGSSAWPCLHGHASVYPWPFLHLHKSKMLCKCEGTFTFILRMVAKSAPS